MLDRDLFAAGDKSNVSVSQINCVTTDESAQNLQLQNTASIVYQCLLSDFKTDNSVGQAGGKP